MNLKDSHVYSKGQSGELFDPTWLMLWCGILCFYKHLTPLGSFTIFTIIKNHIIGYIE